MFGLLLFDSNVTTICDLPGGDSSKQFFMIAMQIELDCLPGIKVSQFTKTSISRSDINTLIMILIIDRVCHAGHTDTKKRGLCLLRRIHR